MIHNLSLLNIALPTPETMTNIILQNSCLTCEDEHRSLTLSQRVEGTDGRGICGDADFFLRHGALDIHRQRAVYVCVQVVHHSGRERHIH